MLSSSTAGHSTSAKQQTATHSDSALSASQLQTLTRDFNEVLSELQGDSSLLRFREEYEALFRALLQSHESEAKLLQECNTLTARISDSTTLVQQTVKEQHEHGNALLMLNKEIGETESKVDNTNFRLQSLTAARDAVVSELGDLTALRTSQTRRISDLDSEIASAQSALASVTMKSDKMASAQRQQEEELRRLREEESVAVSRLSADGERMASLRDLIRQRREECVVAEKENERLLQDIKSSRSHLDELVETLKKPQDDVAAFRAKTKKAKEESLAAKKEADLLQNEAERTEAELVRVRRLNQEQQARLDRFSEEVESQAKEVHMLEMKRHKEENHLASLSHKCQALEEELEELKKQKTAAQLNLDHMQAVTKSVQQELDKLERVLHKNDAMLVECKREKEALIAATTVSSEKVNLFSSLNEQFLRTITQKEQENRDVQTAIDQLLAEQDKLLVDKKEFERKMQQLKLKQQHANTQKAKLIEEIQRQEGSLATVKEKIIQQRQHCDAVVREQALLGSTLTVSNKELQELETKFEDINKKIKKMNDKVSSLDNALVQTHLAKQKLNRNTEHLKDQIARILKKQSRLDELLADQSGASVQLDQVLLQGKRETQLQSNELNTLIHEREIITRQLSKRSNELALLYEKIRIQQSLLTKGANRYRQLMGDIDAVDFQLKQKTYTLNRLSIGNKKLNELYNEFLSTQKQLQEEQSKSLLLSEEVNKKVNVHAFRRLIEADPALYEVLQKIQALEKRIIVRIDKVADLKKIRDQLVDDIDDVKLKIRRSRDVQELGDECRARKTYIHARNQQIASLEDEVSSLRYKILDSKLELAKLAEEKVEVMKKYFAGKSKERRLMETLQTESLASSNTKITGKLVTSIPRFAGGGFCLSRPE